jgi:hypothetical protein
MKNIKKITGIGVEKWGGKLWLWNFLGLCGQKNSGEYRSRTDDLLLARQAL